MKVNHVNLTVVEVRAAAALLETYLGLQSHGGNAEMMVLLNDAGLVLTLMKAGRSTTVKCPDNFHIGFFIEDEATVDAINQRLREDGFDVPPPEPHHAYGFYVQTPGGFTADIGS